MPHPIRFSSRPNGVGAKMERLPVPKELWRLVDGIRALHKVRPQGVLALLSSQNKEEAAVLCGGHLSCKIATICAV